MCKKKTYPQYALSTFNRIQNTRYIIPCVHAIRPPKLHDLYDFYSKCGLRVFEDYHRVVRTCFDSIISYRQIKK